MDEEQADDTGTTIHEQFWYERMGLQITNNRKCENLEKREGRKEREREKMTKEMYENERREKGRERKREGRW